MMNINHKKIKNIKNYKKLLFKKLFINNYYYL